MWNFVELHQNNSEAIRATIRTAFGRLPSREQWQSPRDNQIREQEVLLNRYQMMRLDTIRWRFFFRGKSLQIWT
jgi:hypothetical protein